jgi:hypothetical protein
MQVADDEVDGCFLRAIKHICVTGANVQTWSKLMGRRKDALRESDACSSSNIPVEQLRHYDRKTSKSEPKGVHCDGRIVANSSHYNVLFRYV